MYTARRIDFIERELVARGEAFFQASGSGHEASAALAPALIAEDFLHCHYRDKALILARGIPPSEFFSSLLCNGASHSVGRQMSAHLSARSLNILSIAGPVGNSALQAVGVAREINKLRTNPLVVCSIGDGTTQQGEVLEAIAEAVRSCLPVLFLMHDNHYSISTRTKGQTFYSLPSHDADSYYGLPIHRNSGSDPLSCATLFQKLTGQMRATRTPALCVMDVERLADHTNADDETVYRPSSELARIRIESDPILNLRKEMIAGGISEYDIIQLEKLADKEVSAAADCALHGSPTLQCKDLRRTGIVFGIMVKAAISLIDSELVANSIEKFRESIDSTRRISIAAR